MNNPTTQLKSLKNYPEALTVKEAAEILRVSTKLVYRSIRGGEIPAVKIGRELRISKTQLIRHLKASHSPRSNQNCVLSDNTREKGWTSEPGCDMYGVAKPEDKAERGNPHG